MTHVPHRILRNQAMTALNRERGVYVNDYRDGIMDDATPLFALHRPASLTLAGIAHALDVSASVLRTCFSDLDGLLGAILLRHIKRALNAAGHAGLQGRHPGARRAYLAATRAPNGELSRDHALFLAYRHVLAPDQILEIDAQRADLAYVLGGRRALDLCDSPAFLAEDIEHALGASAPAPKPLAANPPAPAPQAAAASVPAPGIAQTPVPALHQPHAPPRRDPPSDGLMPAAHAPLPQDAALSALRSRTKTLQNDIRSGTNLSQPIDLPVLTASCAANARAYAGRASPRAT